MQPRLFVRGARRSTIYYVLLNLLRALHALRLKGGADHAFRKPVKTREAVLIRWQSNLPESTGGEAWGCKDSREGGVQVPVVLRAPFYAGTKSSGLHAGDT